MLENSSNKIMGFSKEKTSKKFRKKLFMDTRKLDEGKKMETLAFSQSKMSEDNLSFLTHNIPLNKAQNEKNNTLQSELDICLKNSEFSHESDLNKTQNLVFLP